MSNELMMSFNLSSSVTIFSSCPNLSQHQSLFQSWLFASGGQSIGSFNFSISPYSEYSGLMSFRVDWFDLLAAQGTLKNLFQHRSSKASILQHSAFFMIQLSHMYMTSRKAIALTVWTFAGKVISLLLNILSGFVRAFLPRCKFLLISWLQSPSAVILEPKKVESVTVSISPPPKYLPWSDATRFHDLRFLNVKPAFSLFYFTFIKRLFSSSLLSAIKVVSSACLRLLIFLPAILIPACDSSSLAFHMMYSA